MKSLLLLVLCGYGLSAFAAHPQLRNYVESDNVNGVQRLIESGQAQVNDTVDGYSNGEQVAILISAARAGSVKVTRYLIHKNVNLNAKTSVNETALMFACFFDGSYWTGTPDTRKQDQVAMALVDAGANLENDDWWAPLAYAAYNNRLEIGEYLVGHGARVNGPVMDGVAAVNSPLMMASMQGHLDFVKMLLREGADPQLANSRGDRAINLAKKYNHKKIVTLLDCAMKNPTPHCL